MITEFRANVLLLPIWVNLPYNGTQFLGNWSLWLEHEKERIPANCGTKRKTCFARGLFYTLGTGFNLHPLFHSIHRHFYTVGEDVSSRWRYWCLCIWWKMPEGHVRQESWRRASKNWLPKLAYKILSLVPVDWLEMTWHSKQSYFCLSSLLTSFWWQMAKVWPPIEAILHFNSIH